MKDLRCIRKKEIRNREVCIKTEQRKGYFIFIRTITYFVPARRFIIAFIKGSSQQSSGVGVIVALLKRRN